MSEFTYGVPAISKDKAREAITAASYNDANDSKEVSTQVAVAIEIVEKLASISARKEMAMSHSGNKEDPDHFVLNVSFSDPEEG